MINDNYHQGPLTYFSDDWKLSNLIRDLHRLPLSPLMNKKQNREETVKSQQYNIQNLHSNTWL